MSDLLVQRHAVSVDFMAGGEVQSNGIAYEDYSRMSTLTHKLNSGRQAPTPDWVFNDTKLRSVIVGCVEARAYNQPSTRRKLTGTDAERLARAQQCIAAVRPHLETRIDQLCKQYVAAKHAGELALAKKLAQKVEEVDTQLRMLDAPAKYFAGVAYHYWRSGLNSVETAQELGLRPTHVRRLLWRMGKVAGELGYGALKNVSKRSEESKVQRSAREKALRAARKETRKALRAARKETRKAAAQLKREGRPRHNSAARLLRKREARQLKYEAACQAAMLTLKHRKDDATVLLAAKKLVELYTRRNAGLRTA